MSRSRRRRRRPAYLVYEDTYIITQAQAADILEVPLSKLAAWRRRNEGPFYIKLGPYIRYSYADLMEYLPDPSRSSSSKDDGP
jgi:helix-turn-helix protein